jgi:hypothetical protein
MALRRKRRCRREQRQCRDGRSPIRSPQTDAVRASEEEWLSLTWLLGAPGELRDARGTAPRARQEGAGTVDEAPLTGPTATPGLSEAPEVKRLAYTRHQAAEALGVSISTIDRRLVPTVDTVKTPWGQRLIPLDELERFLREHLEPARGHQPRRPAGRPQTLPRGVVERIRLEYARGRGLSEIAGALSVEGVPTAHGGQRWWPSTVRAVLVRSSPIENR